MATKNRFGPELQPDHMIVVTRHSALCRHLQDLGICESFENAEGRKVQNWKRHVQVNPDLIFDRDVIHDSSVVIPVWMLAYAKSVTVIPLDMNYEDHNQRYLVYDRIREIAGAPMTYHVDGVPDYWPGSPA